MYLQSFTIEDISSLPELQPDGWGDLAPVFDFYISSAYCFPIKITIDNRIVGVGSTIIHNDVAWLAHIIVHHNYRNKGIGRFITQSLINSIDSNQCKTIYLIATDLGASVYDKLGFETEVEYLFYKDLKPRTTFIASEHITPYDTVFKEAIQAIDFIVSGEDRISHMEPYLAEASLYVTNHIPEGYYLPHFGDGLIIATTSEAGIALMALRLQTKEHAVFPIQNIDAVKYMSTQDFKPFKIAKRMRLGKYREMDLSKIFNRVAGSIG